MAMKPTDFAKALTHYLSVYKHEGFWKAMDTYREVEELNKLWEDGKPWAAWEDKKLFS